MCKVSVIVPVYNVEKYLKKCLDSLISQTFMDIEIILVDDGSKDNSGIICDEYAKKDERIKVFHKQNEGLSLTRKFGVEKAVGEYIAFIDSDDYAENNFLYEMYSAIKENDADIAECDYTVFSEKMRRRKFLYNAPCVKEREDFLNDIVKKTIIYGETAIIVWNKIYKREYITSLVKNYGVSPLEDYIFNIQYYVGVNKYVYINNSLINYRQVQNSLSKSYNPKTYSILKQVWEQKLNFMKNVGLNDNECIELSNQWYIKYVYNFSKNIFVMRNGLKLKDKRNVVMDILSDGQLLEICKNTEKKNKFITNVISGKYSKIIRDFEYFGYKMKIRYLLSKIKFVFVRSNV